MQSMKNTRLTTLVALVAWFGVLLQLALSLLRELCSASECM